MKRKIVKSWIMFAIVGSLLTGCGASSETMMATDQAVTESTAGNRNTAKSEAKSTASNHSTSYDILDNKTALASEDSVSSAKDEGIAYDTNDSYEEVPNEEVAVEEDDAATTVETQTQNLDTMTLLEEKLVYYCDLDIETLDYAGTMSAIKDTIKKYGGVIQSENESDDSYHWYYEDYRKTSGTLHNYLQVRIPSEKYESFLSELDGIGKIISKSTSVDNISQQYYDTTTQIEALQIQEKNLLAMLEKCETIEDMITVQERLSEVQYELNSLQTTKRYMDVDVAYSYVNINVSEVLEYHRESEPVKTSTFIDRLQNTLRSTGTGFLSFMEGLLFVVIRLMPYLLIAAVICLIFRKKIKQKLDDRKADKAAKRAQKELRRQAIMQQQQAVRNQQPTISQPTTNQQGSNNQPPQKQ